MKTIMKNKVLRGLYLVQIVFWSVFVVCMSLDMLSLLSPYISLAMSGVLAPAAVVLLVGTLILTGVAIQREA